MRGNIKTTLKNNIINFNLNDMQIKLPISVFWKRGIVIFLFMMFFSCSAVMAQMLVRGMVVDRSGETIPGASVQIKGTKKGTVSDLDGKFSLTVPNKRAVLVVSFIGYKTVQKQVDVSKPMSIVLREDA